MYACFADGSLPELVEVDEELLDADSVFEDDRLQALLHVQLNVQKLLRPGQGERAPLQVLALDRCKGSGTRRGDEIYGEKEVR